mmetsp:Transcript_10423/g.15227  ORF Transcript_10423/g.15227 Transcript_10423/m.15227 type:complete len:259 (-) Transcript_10423:148-924(-)
MMCLKQCHLRKLQVMASNEEDTNLSPAQLQLQFEATISDGNVMLPLDIWEDKEKYYCVMPLGSADLFDYFDAPNNLREEEARYILDQILNGLQTLQEARMCHRDLSLENFIVDKQGRPLIIDYGMCLKIPYKNDQRCLISPQEPCGKGYCMSPEIYHKEIFDGHAIDLWAIGPILYMLMRRRSLWDWPQSMEPKDPFEYFSTGHFKDVAQNRWNLSDDLIDLLHHMFLENPRDRLSLQQIRNHPWMQGEMTIPLPPDL